MVHAHSCAYRCNMRPVQLTRLGLSQSRPGSRSVAQGECGMQRRHVTTTIADEERVKNHDTTRTVRLRNVITG